MTEDEFWSARPVLEHIKQFAHARMCAPFAVLGAALPRAVGIIPPVNCLPPPPARSSINLFIALCGPSGAGKGTSEATARDAIEFLWQTGESVHLPELPIGSGEGIARTFMPPKDESQQVFTAIFSVPEVDTAASLFSRSGSTLESELRKVFSGEQLGFTNAQAHTRTKIDAHSYRASLIFGVQPRRAGVLLDGTDGGTPQRLVWLPVLDPDMPDERPPEPAPMVIRQPRFASSADLSIPKEATDAIARHQLAKHRGEVDPLDGHRLLVRLKVSAGLMVLDNRDTPPSISTKDWELAGVVMDVSDRTRRWVQNERTQVARANNRAKALATADRDDIVSDRKLTRAKQAVLRWLPSTGEMPSADLRRKLKADLRDFFGAAVAELAAEGEIYETKLKNGVTYGRITQSTRVPEGHPTYQQFNEGVREGTRVPEATVTDIDSRRSHESEPKVSDAQQFRDYIAECQAARLQKICSKDAIAALEPLGVARHNIFSGANDHPDVTPIGRDKNGAIWWIDPSTPAPVSQTASECLTEYIAPIANNTELDFGAIATEYEELHSRQNLLFAGKNHPDIKVESAGRGHPTKWTVQRGWRDQAGTDSEVSA